MKARRRIIAVTVAFISASASGADCSWGPEDLNIRKSLVFSQDEQEPARLAAQSVAGEKDSITLADLAVRMRQYDCVDYRFVPMIEYHKDTSRSKPVDNVSASLKIQAEPSWLNVTTKDYIAVLDIIPSFKKDMVSQVWSGSVSALIYGSKNYGPSVFGGRLNHAVPAVDGKGHEESLKLQTIAYVGLDHYFKLPELIANVPSATTTVASYVVLRYYLECWPEPHLNEPGLQLLANANYRQSIGGGIKHPKSIGISANYYIDGKNRAAIGIDYEKGNIQMADFVESEKTSLLLKVKF